MNWNVQGIAGGDEMKRRSSRTSTPQNTLLRWRNWPSVPGRACRSYRILIYGSRRDLCIRAAQASIHLPELLKAWEVFYAEVVMSAASLRSAPGPRQGFAEGCRGCFFAYRCQIPKSTRSCRQAPRIPVLALFFLSFPLSSCMFPHLLFQ